MARITCSVSNCQHWKSGNVCDASEILVTSDSIGNDRAETLGGMGASTARPTPVGSCRETCCKTYRAGSDQARTDDVRM